MVILMKKILTLNKIKQLKEIKEKILFYNKINYNVFIQYKGVEAIGGG